MWFEKLGKLPPERSGWGLYPFHTGAERSSKKAIDSGLQKNSLSLPNLQVKSTLYNLGTEKEQFYLVIFHLNLKGKWKYMQTPEDLPRCFGNVTLFLCFGFLFVWFGFGFYASFW